MNTTDSKMQNETKPCNMCFTPIPSLARKCASCGSMQFAERRCVICAEAIPEDARKCNHCDAYQGWLRRRFTFSNTVLSLLTALFAVIASLFSAASWIGDRQSHTEFKVMSGNENILYIQVWNTGRKPSAIRGGKLRFLGRLPLDDATVSLAVGKDGDVTSIVVPDNPSKIGLTVNSLQPSDKPRIKLLLAQDVGNARMLELELEVEESGHLWDLTPHPYVATRRDRFPANRIHDFIMGRMVDRAKK